MLKMAKYGDLPSYMTEVDIKTNNEMFHYQYLPIKLAGDEFSFRNLEPRLYFASRLIRIACSNFGQEFGREKYRACYAYLTAKSLYVTGERNFNRQGYHSDGFMSDDINYIWYDRNPTVFNSSEFNLSQDDSLALKEMNEQALPENEITYPNSTLIRLDQFNIHKVGPVIEEGLRTFIKISFSDCQYNLEGNSHNYLLDYRWNMKPRNKERNIPCR
jgi:hypothetical protein